MGEDTDLEVQRALGRIESHLNDIDSRLIAAEGSRKRQGDRLTSLERKFWWACGAVAVIATVGPEILSTYLT